MKYSFKVNFKENIKKKKVNFKTKKAIMALDALIGTILSVIALFFLLQLAYMFFFQDNDINLKIAKDDAQSIVDFVNTYSINQNNPYFDYDNCFYILKLQNLENFQIQKSSEKTYSYIISKDGVYIINNDDVKQFEENLDLRIAKVFYKFDNSINFKKDDTNSGSLAKVELFLIFSVGEFGSFEIKKDLEKNIIILKQGENNFGKGFDNNNILFPFVYDTSFKSDSIEWIKTGIWGGQPKNFKLAEGGYLVFSKNYFGKENIFFATNNELSNIFVKNNLCSKKHLEKINNDIYYSKPENIVSLDYFNKKISFSCISKENVAIRLIWDNGFKCENEKCDEILKKIDITNYNSLFIDNDPSKNSFKDFCSTEPNLEVKESNQLFNINNKINFNSVFEEDKIGFENKNLIDLTEKEKEKNNFVILKNWYNIFNWGAGINNCNKDKYFNLCKDIYFKNGKTYFYVLDNKQNLHFYSFNDKVLRKKTEQNGKVKVYFLDKEVEYDEPIKLDIYGSAWSKANGVMQSFSAIFGGGNDDLKVYELKINNININGFELKDFSIYLSPVQFLNIQEISNEEVIKIIDKK